MSADRTELAAAVRRMRDQGASYHAIGRKLGVSQQVAWRAVNGRSDRRPRTGRVGAWSAYMGRHRGELIAAALDTVLVIAAVLMWRRALRARSAAQVQARADASRAEPEPPPTGLAPSPMVDPPADTPATTEPQADGGSAPSEATPEEPNDPNIDPLPPEFMRPLDELGRAIRPRLN